MTDLRAVRGGRLRRERPAADDVVRDLERDVIGSLVLDPSKIPAVAESVSPREFADPRLGLLLERITESYREGRPVTLPALADELDQRDELERIGGRGELAALSDVPLSATWAVEHARRVRRLSRERRVALLHERGAAGIREPGDLDELVRLEAEIAALDAPATAAVEVMGFSGDSLRTIADRPEPPSPLPGLLDTCASLHILVGRPKTGKTTLGLHLAQSWACGVPPWDGAPALPGTRALVLSAEQSLRRIASTLRRLAEWHPEAPRDGWADRIRVVARDRDLSREARPLLRLDQAGLALLRRMLLSAAEAADPFGFVLLDSLSRLKPSEAEENNADHLTAFLDPLAALATDLGIYIVLVHHQGHEDRSNPVTAPRGSTSIAAVAQAVWQLEPVDRRPWQRSLAVSGNALDHGAFDFEVAPDSEPGKVLYFRPVDPFADYDMAEMASLGLTAIAKRVQGDGDKPSGAALRKARQIEAELRRRGMRR